LLGRIKHAFSQPKIALHGVVVKPNKSSLALKGQVVHEFTEVSFCESQMAFPKGQSFTIRPDLNEGWLIG